MPQREGKSLKACGNYHMQALLAFPPFFHFLLNLYPLLSPPRNGGQSVKKCFKTNERQEAKATLTKPIPFWECFGPKAKPMTTRKGHSAVV